MGGTASTTSASIMLSRRLAAVRRSGPKGFHVLPRRWVVERTFGWMI